MVVSKGKATMTAVMWLLLCLWIMHAACSVVAQFLCLTATRPPLRVYRLVAHRCDGSEVTPQRKKRSTDRHCLDYGRMQSVCMVAVYMGPAEGCAVAERDAFCRKSSPG